MKLTWKTFINVCGRIMHSWIPSGQSPGLHSSMSAFKQRLGGSPWLRGVGSSLISLRRLPSACLLLLKQLISLKLFVFPTGLHFNALD